MAREPAPLNWRTFIIVLALALGLGSLYRFTDLAKKPMHTDEAILAIKSQEYWQTGTFEYDPKDYHGPFLHFATRWIGEWKGWHAADLSEGEVRWVVAVFGLGLVLLPLFLIDVLGRTGAVTASLLTAVSPMMAYYSRYYIMEVPLVFLLGLFIVSLWRWTQGRNLLWLLLAGACLGLMHATKETFVLNMAAMGAAWALVRMHVGTFDLRSGKMSYVGARQRIPSWTAWAIVGGVAALTSVWMFSNGFKNWQGVTDSVATYESYLRRSGGSGHEKPWHYYLGLLAWSKDGFVWSEGLILGLALLGIGSAFLDRRRPRHHAAFLSFLSLYAVILLGIYCLIPYKTPWSVLAVDHALMLLAGVGMRTVFRAFQFPVLKTILVVLFGLGVYNLCQQTNLATDYAFPGQTRYAADSRNPYVYSHTSTSLVELARRIHGFAAVHPDGLAMPVQVIQSEQGWPLPWYLRDMSHVGYQSKMPDAITVPVIVTDLAREPEVRALLYREYVSSVYGLRPGVTLVLLTEKALWERFLNPNEPPPPPAPPAPPPIATGSPVDLPTTSLVTPPPGVTGPSQEVGAVPVPALPADIQGRMTDTGTLPYSTTMAHPAPPPTDPPVPKAQPVTDDEPVTEPPPPPEPPSHKPRP